MIKVRIVFLSLILMMLKAQAQDILVTFEDVSYIADNRVRAVVYVQNLGSTAFIGAVYGSDMVMYPSLTERGEFYLTYNNVTGGRETREVPTSITVETIFGGHIPMDMPMYEFPTTGTSSGQRWEVLFPRVLDEASNVTVSVLGVTYELGDRPKAKKLKQDMIAAREKEDKEKAAEANGLEAEGLTLIRSGRFIEGVDKLRAAISLAPTIANKVNPQIAKALIEIGDSLRLVENFAEAITRFNEAISADKSTEEACRPKLADCYLEIAESNYQQGYYAFAIKNYMFALQNDESKYDQISERLSECKKKEAQRQYDQGTSQYETGDFERAISSFGSAESLDSSWRGETSARTTDCYILLGEREIKNKNYPTAAQRFGQAARINSNSHARVEHRLSQLKRTPAVVAAFSLIPGGGQLVNEQPKKARIHFAAFIVLTAISLIELNIADDNYSKYEAATDTRSAKDYYKKTNAAWTTCLIAGGASATLISFSMWDAFQSARKYNSYLRLP